jgi:PhnB protein
MEGLQRKETVMQLQPYLFFEGRCEEAARFYEGAVGAKVERMIRFKESPDPGLCRSDQSDKIMHMSLRIGDHTMMASDGQCQGSQTYQGFALSLTVKGETEADRRFKALAEGGKVVQPLIKTFFSPRFGMVTDRFGVSWMIHAAP